MKQACVQLPTSADNVTLLAVAADRLAAGCLAATAVDWYLPPARPTAANPSHAAGVVDKWDRQTYVQTDRQTDRRRIITITLPHTMRAV